MGLATYLPSAQFSIMATSIMLAGGLIWAADYYTSPHAPAALAPAPSTTTTQGMDWKAALANIQGESVLPEPPSAEAIANLLAAAESPNVTDSVGRTLLVNLGEAKAQGLGSDVPTQEKIVANALAKIEPSQEVTLYSTSNLTIVPDSPETLRAYGNSFVTTVERYPGASLDNTLVTIGEAIDSNTQAKLAPLATIGAAYHNIAESLALLPVPQTLVPLHLQIVNNYARIAATYPDLQATLTDPLRGIGGLKLYQSLTQETGRLFINIAQAFEKNGILFSENEPGVAWSLIVAP